MRFVQHIPKFISGQDTQLDMEGTLDEVLHNEATIAWAELSDFSEWRVAPYQGEWAKALLMACFKDGSSFVAGYLSELAALPTWESPDGSAPDLTTSYGAKSQGDISMPPMPPHFWVAGWNWQEVMPGPMTAMTVFVSIDRPKSDKHPEAFLAMPELEHQMYLRLNRSEVWAQVVKLAKELQEQKLGLADLILTAHQRGKAEFEAL